MGSLAMYAAVAAQTFSGLTGMVASQPAMLARAESRMGRMAGQGVVLNASAERDGEWSAWMKAAQDGDEAAYARLLRALVPFIRTAARSQGSQPDHLDDVVQDVLLTIHRVRHTYDPDRPLTAWVRAITQRRAINLMRRSMRRGMTEIHAPLAYEAVHDPAPNPAEAAFHGADRGALNLAIAQLPDGQRDAVKRLALAEQSLDEASRETGKTKVSLKVALHRGLKSLRSIMETRP